MARDLATEGYDAAHVQELGLSRASDEDILDRAVDEDRIVISADTDFGYLLRDGRRTAPSVILIRDARATPRQRHDLLVEVLQAHADALAFGALVVVRRSTGARVRPLPLEI